MDESTGKSCSRCKVLQPLSVFGMNRATSDGLQYHCRACDKASREARTPAQRQQARERNAAYMARYRAEHGEDVNTKQREFAAANPDLIREYRRRFRANSPEKFDAIRERDREAARLRASLWVKSNPQKNRDKQHRRRARLRIGLVGPVDLDALWTGVCALCGFEIDALLKYPDPLSRSVDHIIPLARGGSHTQDNVQWAHLVCNLRKYVTSP